MILECSTNVSQYLLILCFDAFDVFFFLNFWIWKERHIWCIVSVRRNFPNNQTKGEIGTQQLNILIISLIIRLIKQISTKGTTIWFWGGGGGGKSYRDRLLIFSTCSAIPKPQYFFQLQQFLLIQQKRGLQKRFSMCYEKIFHMLQYFADFHYNGNTRPLQT